MVAFYNAADQELYKKYQYIPQEKYRLGLNLPTDAPATPPGGGGIVNTNAFANSGGGGNNGFSVYNADPNTITNMNPNMNALQDARYDNELSYVGKSFPGNIDPLYSTNTEAMKNMEMYPEYYGLDAATRKARQPSKAAELLSKGINLIPGMGLLKTGTAFLGDFANRYLPVNRRAIMENQLGADGVMVNDIGQIVVGRGREYNTPEGIMAGYNVSAMDDETFTGRQDVMRNTLDQKYGLSKEQIDGLIDGSLTEEEMEDINKQAFNKTLNRPSDIISKIRNTEIARKNFNNTTGKTDEIVDIKTDTKTNNQNQSGGDDGGGDTPIGPGGTGSRRGDSDIPDRNRGGYATDDTASFFAKGGRVYLNLGGLASIL